MTQLDNFIINDWKSLTHNFEDAKVWQERLECLGLKNDEDFYTYLKDLNDESFNSKEIFFLKKILSCVVECENNFDCISVLIAKEATDYIRNSYISFSNLRKYYNEDAFSDIFIQLQQNITDLIKPMIDYEFDIYKKAYGDEKMNIYDFFKKVTYVKEWLSYFFESYPVLLKLLIVFVDNIKSNSTNLFQRLNEDLEEIKERFRIADICDIYKISLFLGDPHRSGQTTTAIWVNTSIGKTHCFYYKPRTLSPDIYWNNFVLFLESIGLDKSQHLTENIDKSQYGWQLGLELKNTFSTEGELKSFFFNQGINTAIAYFFNVQDLIADNITISSNYPSFFDLEMFFCPQNPIGDDYRTKSAAGSAFLLSVIKTGLIPNFGFETANQIGYSNSGVSHIGKNNLPIINNKVVVIADYCKDFELGFRNTCNFFIKHKFLIVNHLVTLKDCLSKMHTRVLIRFTYTYFQLLKEAHLPIYMSKNIEYNKLLGYLWRGYNKKMLPAKVIQNEIQQLALGDIPYFLSMPLSKDLYDHNGNVIITNYFGSTGYEVVMKKIQDINPQIISEQINIIRRSFYIHENSNAPIEFKFPLVHSNSDSLLTKVEEIASFIYELDPIKSDSYFAYADYIVSKEDMWTQGIQNIDMFQGIESIGLFLTAYYSISHDQHALSVALKIFNQSLEYLNSNKYALLDNNKAKIGIVNFPISTIYYALLGNQILNNDFFQFDKNTLSFILRYIDEKLQYDEHYCYFSGATGSVLLLMKLYDRTPTPELYSLIEKMGNYLISSSVELNGNMIFWEKKVFDKWGGFVHGNSSTSYALFKISDFLKNTLFYDKAIKSLAYDQSLFNFEKKKWNKSIDFEGDTHHSWGNGSAGIGLSRLLIMPYYKNEFMEYEIKIVKENIDRELLNIKHIDHSVCSGLLGMIEIRSLLDPAYDYQHILDEVFSNIPIYELQCGGWKENPLVTGLFYGYAGIGYNLIKLLYNKNTPSLLWI